MSICYIQQQWLACYPKLVLCLNVPVKKIFRSVFSFYEIYASAADLILGSYPKRGEKLHY